ncbi:unnamed protein product [Cyprideis torosa]|uniref:Immediate early response 3-interacting protein 1 n=1 Tax=Cyprideis torosa TaxID=163714 RepID=A0A7R8W6Q4_9CRUS|nr:unnamed protein product [Cyprideis torosa]CAG0886749.1 unnamed protein product [Cyprideis torosa]
MAATAIGPSTRKEEREPAGSSFDQVVSKNCIGMALSLYCLLEAAIFVLNGICVLNEERFLSRLKWAGGGEHQIQGFGEAPGATTQILNLIRSIRTVMRIPLIFLNICLVLSRTLLG